MGAREQNEITRLLRDDRRREVYECAAPDGSGSGIYAVSRNPNGNDYSRADIDALLAGEYIIENPECPGMFKLNWTYK